MSLGARDFCPVNPGELNRDRGPAFRKKKLAPAPPVGKQEQFREQKIFLYQVAQACSPCTMTRRRGVEATSSPSRVMLMA